MGSWGWGGLWGICCMPAFLSGPLGGSKGSLASELLDWPLFCSGGPHLQNPTQGQSVLSSRMGCGLFPGPRARLLSSRTQG